MGNKVFFSSARTKEPPSVYRTSNQAYGSRAPTVHEMPVRVSRKQGEACTEPAGGASVGGDCSSGFLKRATPPEGEARGALGFRHPQILLEWGRVEINESEFGNEMVSRMKKAPPKGLAPASHTTNQLSPPKAVRFEANKRRPAFFLE